jgi:hypothetical protein
MVYLPENRILLIFEAAESTNSRPIHSKHWKAQAQAGSFNFEKNGLSRLKGRPFLLIL